MQILKFLVCFALVNLATDAISQNLLEVINKSEEAAFDIRTFSSSGQVIGQASGFFISSDGLAITMGDIFQEADSALVRTRNGKDYLVSRVLSTHPQTNMTLIKVEPFKNRRFDFLNPSKTTFLENEELLALTHPDDPESGASLSKIDLIRYSPFVSRSGIAESVVGSKSNGSALVNRRGELSGVLWSIDNHKKKVVYNAYLLNDTNWVTVNTLVRDLKYKSNVVLKLNSGLSQGIAFLLCDENVEAAKVLSRYLRVYPNDDFGFLIRGWARVCYNNMVGSRSDFDEALRLNAKAYLPYYFRGLAELDEKKLASAKTNFEICIARNSHYAPAIIEMAKLRLKEGVSLNYVLQTFDLALRYDTLNAEVYYERARLLNTYAYNESKIRSNINKAIYLNPNLIGVFTIRGMLSFSNKNYSDAIKDFNMALDKDPNDVHALYNRGISNYNMGLSSRACADWFKAGQLGEFKAYDYLSRYCK